MDDKIQQALMGLLGDMVGAIKGLREKVEQLQNGQAKIFVTLEENQDMLKVSTMRLNDVALLQQNVDEIYSIVESLSKSQQPTESAPVKKRASRKKKVEQEHEPTAIEKSVCARMKRDLGDDVQCPRIEQGDKAFLVNGFSVDQSVVSDVLKAKSDFPAATLIDIAESTKIPEAAVYFVDVMMEQRKKA